MSSLQPSLFEIVKQPRRLSKEVDPVYDAVVSLRANGFRVQRGGRDCFLVNGETYVLQRFLSLARKEERKAQGRRETTMDIR